MAQKCGNCQMNCIPKIISASCDIAPVAAVHPKSGGNAPGMAPTNTAMGPTRFKGVYTKLYSTIDKIDNDVVSQLVNTMRIPAPTKKQTTAKTMLSLIESLFVGNGRFMVRTMSLSRSISII